MTTAPLTKSELQMLVDKRAQELREYEIEQLALAQIEQEREEEAACQHHKQAEEQRRQIDRLRAANLAALNTAVDTFGERVAAWRQKTEEVVKLMEEAITGQQEIYQEMDAIGTELVRFLVIHERDSGIDIKSLKAIHSSLQQRLVGVDVNFIIPAGNTNTLPVQRARSYVTSKLPPRLRSALIHA